MKGWPWSKKTGGGVWMGEDGPRPMSAEEAEAEYRLQSLRSAATATEMQDLQQRHAENLQRRLNGSGPFGGVASGGLIGQPASYPEVGTGMTAEDARQAMEARHKHNRTQARKRELGQVAHSLGGNLSNAVDGALHTDKVPEHWTEAHVLAWMVVLAERQAAANPLSAKDKAEVAAIVALGELV